MYADHTYMWYRYITARFFMKQIHKLSVRKLARHALVVAAAAVVVVEQQ
jgi:hypothetical protein